MNTTSRDLSLLLLTFTASWPDRESPGVVTIEFEFRALYIYILCYPICGDEIDLSVQQRDTPWTAVIRSPLLKLLHCIALIFKEAKICMYS
jgi:hypothetical protein